MVAETWDYAAWIINNNKKEIRQWKKFSIVIGITFKIYL